MTKNEIKNEIKSVKCKMYLLKLQIRQLQQNEKF